MSEENTNRPTAVDTLDDIQLPALAPTGNLPAVSEEAKPLVEQIDLRDTSSIMMFGTEAQADLQKVSQNMLEGVRNKDTGAAGESIRTMVTTLKGFSISQDDLRDKPTLMERLMGKVTPLMQFKEKYTSVRSQIETIAGHLENHKTTLMADIKDLDTLYAKTLDYYKALGFYIEAGEARLNRARTEEIPAAESAMEAANEDDKIMAANEVRDLRSAADDLERRIHDLKLTRQVTMQAIPSIRLIQENDKSLIQKISSTLVNTVPLWQTQLAQGLAINNSAQAADALKGATDLTNDLLMSNAKNLRQANATIRTQVERGVFDIEAVKKANAELIGTLEDSLQIADKAKKDRAASEAELKKLEGDLRQSLAAAKARDAA